MTVGAIPYVVISLAIVGLVLIIMGFMLDAILSVDNDLMQDQSLPYSHERAATLGLIASAFNWMGFVSLITAVLFMQMNANQESSGDI
jgi:hypothetical protein